MMYQKLTIWGVGCWQEVGAHDHFGTLEGFRKAACAPAVTRLGAAEPGRDWTGLSGSWYAAGQEQAAEETHWSDLVGQTALVWVGAVGGGRSADGGGDGYICAGGEERVVCVLAGEGKEEGEVAGSPWGGCCGPPEKAGRGWWDGLNQRSPLCCVWWRGSSS